MLHRAHDFMKHDSRKRAAKHARKHHARMGVGDFMGDPGMVMGGTGPQEVAKMGLGKGGGFQGDWTYNKAARKSHARKHEARHRSHKARKHHSVMGLSESRKHGAHRSHKSHKHAKAYRGGSPTQKEFGKGLHLSRKHSRHDSRHDSRKRAAKSGNPAFGSPAWRAKYMKKGAHKHESHKSHKPVGAHGRAAVHALGRTKTTGNFKKIEREKGKGAAIGAYQNKLAAVQGRKAPYGGKHHAHRSRKHGRKALLRAEREKENFMLEKARFGSHRSRKSYAHKGHTHRSRKAMEAC